MEIQEIVAQFVKAAAEDPSHLEQFGIDPGEAIKNATGLEVSDEQMGDIVGAVEPLLEGKGLDMGKAMEAVGDFLGGDEASGQAVRPVRRQVKAKPPVEGETGSVSLRSCTCRQCRQGRVRFRAGAPLRQADAGRFPIPKRSGRAGRR